MSDRMNRSIYQSTVFRSLRIKISNGAKLSYKIGYLYVVKWSIQSTRKVIKKIILRFLVPTELNDTMCTHIYIYIYLAKKKKETETKKKQKRKNREKKKKKLKTCLLVPRKILVFLVEQYNAISSTAHGTVYRLDIIFIINSQSI